MIQFIVPGKPMGKHRPRFASKGQFNSTYSDKKDVNYETLIALTFNQAYPDHEILSGPLVMEIIAFLPIPKSTAKKWLSPMKHGIIRPVKKPDIDNIAKIVCDALNGVAYEDDNQIVTLVITKYYADKPFLDIKIEAFTGASDD